MPEESEEHELLLAAKAVEQHLISPQDLAKAVAKWTDGRFSDLLSSIESESSLSDDARDQLRKLFLDFEDAPAMDIVESIEDSFFGKLNGALGDIDNDHLQATVTKWLNTDSVELHLVSENERFRVLSEHARGGLGEVLVAKDLQLNRQVALKRIREKWADHDSAKIRFQMEAEITGRLEHPGVVPVYALGKRDDGEIYYAMRFIRGQSLEAATDAFHQARGSKRIDMRSADFRNLLGRFVDVCNTISYAHSRGIIHRDLKPANIMLGKFGETLVVDWGLAKQIGVHEDPMVDEEGGESQIISDLGSGSAPTQTGSAVGTPQFMSPEQATGRLDRMGPSTDVYGLGATLHYVLTGKPPLEGDSLPDILERVEHGEIARPTDVVASIPRPLESICLKAMNRNPSKRYPAVSDLATDVGNAVAGARVSAHQESGLEKIRRWAGENRRMAQVVAMITLLLAVGISAWSTAAVLHQDSLVRQRMTFLLSQADLKGKLVADGVEHLRQDMLLLSKRPQLALSAAAFESDVSTAAEAGNLAAEFEAILGLHPGYMQVRLIGTDGYEKVRVDRVTPGGPLTRLKDSDLQDKGGKDYFRRTRRLDAGDVYLSEVNINMEQGRHQWATPVIRAAAPVLANDDGRFLGAVVVNMHFGGITEALQPLYEDDGLLVYLTDQDGRFLYCSDVPDLAFCFERSVVFPLESLYRELGNFRSSQIIGEVHAEAVVPTPAALVLSSSDNPNAVSAVADQLVGDLATVQVRVSRYEGDDRGAGMLIATSDSTEALKSSSVFDVGEALHVKEIARSITTQQHALNARKIYYDPNAPERFFCLVLAHPY